MTRIAGTYGLRESGIAPIGPPRVFVKELVRPIEVGILAEEYGVTQRVRFQVGATLWPSATAEADLPGYSYADIVEAIDAVTRTRFGLLEDLGEAIAERILADPAVSVVDLVIEKLDRLGGAGVFGVELRFGRPARLPE